MKYIKTFFQVLIFIPIQIIMIPFAIAGIFIGLYKEMVIGPKLGVSFSAGQALQYRYYMHYFDTRPDPLTVEFTKHYPSESHFALWSVLGAFIIARKYFGFKTKISELPKRGEEKLESTAGARVQAYDEIMAKYIDEVEQVLLPGSGLDLIALHFTKDKPVKVFEVDQTNTLKVKVDTLKKANIDHDWITYVPVDYEKESWSEKLLEAGFDKTKKTLIIWQTVSLFLEEEQIKDSLRAMADICPEGSIVVQDFYSNRMVFEMQDMSAKSTRNMMAKMGEPWKFGIDMSHNPKERIESFINDCGLELTGYRQFGIKLGIDPDYCITESRL